jgi:hypothetical protein
MRRQRELRFAFVAAVFPASNSFPMRASYMRIGESDGRIENPLIDGAASALRKPVCMAA